ncbi:SDR family oxidoreductase [Levilactobacillus huananensis]|uniref:SDR family oxidoreductase n=1 Tax=Levilactobacillus huananensis TaxID=2486019 RepID=UPI000F79825B|nr:aldehyde reductase [Levilactobacillus huananensis]
MSKQLVVVTGGSGFIASHIICQLVQQGYAVRTTVRSLKKRPLVLEMLTAGGVQDLSAVSFVEADLTHDAHWSEVMAGATYAIHVASPTPNRIFKDENEMIQPAVEGVRRVLTAARDAGVKRVVLTSAYGAIFAGHPHRTTPYTEADWSNLKAKGIHPYQKSKTLAERAAWAFIAQEGQGMELATVNPVGVMGPVLASDYSHSNVQVRELLEGRVKAVPNVSSGYVDVRDVASLHLLAMTSPKAAGERFLATTGETLSMLDVANVLRAAFPQFAPRLPTRTIPNLAVKMAALVKPELKMLSTLVGQYAETSNEKSRRLLGWQPRSAAEAITATAQSMIDLGLVTA